MRSLWTAAAIASILVLPAERVNSQESAATTDHVVVDRLSSLHGSSSEIIAHIDLTKPFGTKSQWTLVIGKEPDELSDEDPVAGQGPVSICFVKNAVPDCSEEMVLAKYREQKIELSPGERPFYHLFDARVVYSGPGDTPPLLMIKMCTMHGVNGSCGISTFLFDYDRAGDRFRDVFFNITGRNNNQATRFVESGPLLGDVIVAYPSTKAPPYTYDVEVHKRTAAGTYAQALRYKGKTGYGDGNRLAVIDSEMPEILRRLGFWKPGDALPVPPTMPAGCTRLVMRKGVEWCE